MVELTVTGRLDAHPVKQGFPSMRKGGKAVILEFCLLILEVKLLSQFDQVEERAPEMRGAKMVLLKGW